MPVTNSPARITVSLTRLLRVGNDIDRNFSEAAAWKLSMPRPAESATRMSPAADRNQALRLVPVSRETERRLAIYVDLLSRWRRVTNLISEASFAAVWTRHIADSAQLLGLVPNARRWVDLGSGAGFPGMVLAIQLADQPDAIVHMIESDQRKGAFIRAVARETGAAAQVHGLRIESVAPESLLPVDAVTARALAPLPLLLDFAKVWLAEGAVGVFPRGRTTDAQIRDHPRPDALRFETVSSKIDPQTGILIVRRRESAQQ
jgi:16S rRNA (guanine527-N7)-methyltransferase